MSCHVTALCPPVALTKNILPFRRPVRPADTDRVADVLLAIEAAALPPVIVATKGLCGYRVGVAAEGHAFQLTSDEARLVADCLWNDPSVIGFADIASRLRDAAQASDRAFLRSARG